MSWDDDDDSFYAQIDVDSAVQQARAHRQQPQGQPQGQHNSATGPSGRQATPLLPPQQHHAAAGPSTRPHQQQRQPFLQQQQQAVAGLPPAAPLPPQPAQRPSGPPSGPSLRSLFTGAQGASAGAVTTTFGVQAGVVQQCSGGQQGPLQIPPQAGHQQQQQSRPMGPAPAGQWQPQQGKPAGLASHPYQLPPPNGQHPLGPQQQQYRQQPQLGQPPYGQQLHGQQPQPYGQQQQQGYGAAQPLNGYQQQQQQQQQQHLSGGVGASGRLASGSAQSGAATAAASSGQASGPMVYIDLELGKEQMIEVKFGYREEVAQALKRIPGGTWDARSRFWKFPLTHHERIVEALKGLKTVRTTVRALPPIVSEVLKASAASPDDSARYCHIPANLEQQLMPFQREGVQFALKHGGRALIGDEMGLGKTVQAIAIVSAYRDEWPVLIISPSSLREAWADALHRWLGITADRMHIVHSGKDAKDVPKSIHFLIVSYNFVQKMDLGKRFGVVICDESHFLKEGSAQRTKATVPLVKEARRAILLSGTPALNKPKEIFQQLAALVPKAKLKMAEYGERYCKGNHFDKYGGASNLPELNAVLKNSVMVRRLKKEVLTQLPSKRRQQVMLDLDADAKKQLAGLQKQLEIVRQVMGEETRKNVASGNAAGAGGARVEQNAVISQMYNKTAEVKAKAVQDYVNLLLENNQKFLVFGHHTSMLDAIEHACNRYTKGGVKFIRIDGSTPSSKRQSLVNDFQENESYRVAILSIKAAGVGLTLTAASTVVFAEMTWVPGEIVQAEDRAHRIGQANSVNVYFLHARASIDDLIWQSIQNKLDNLGEAIDGEAQAFDARRVEAPDRGQTSLATFMTHSKPDPQQQQQQQQGAHGAGRGGGAAGAIKSPGRTQQTSLLNFFSGGKREQGQQQQQGPGAPLPPQQQQRQQHQGPGALLPPQQQQQQPAHGALLPQQQQQQQQQWQGHPPPGGQQQYHHQPGGAAMPPAPQQHQHHPYHPAENAPQQILKQQQHQQPAGGLPLPLRAPSGIANMQGAPGGQQLTGVKRQLEGS